MILTSDLRRCNFIRKYNTMSFTETGRWQVIGKNETVEISYQLGYLNISTTKAGDGFISETLRAIEQKGSCRIS